MKAPSYVQYKNEPYILAETDGNSGKILDPATQVKLQVNLSNLSVINTEQPKEVSTRFGDFFVTPKGTIISKVTLRNVYRNTSPVRAVILNEASKQVIIEGNE